MIPVNLDSLLVHLREKNYEVQIQTETHQIYHLFKIKGQEFPLFLRIVEGGVLIQLLLIIPTELKNSAVNDTARLLHLLNKELDIPGFGMDEIEKLIYYRMMLPTSDQKIPETILDTFFKAIHAICEGFSPAIFAVASGDVKFEEILEKARKQG
jgi:hypothetical protein